MTDSTLGLAAEGQLAEVIKLGGTRIDSLVGPRRDPQEQELLAR